MILVVSLLKLKKAASGGKVRGSSGKRLSVEARKREVAVEYEVISLQGTCSISSGKERNGGLLQAAKLPGASCLQAWRSAL